MPHAERIASRFAFQTDFRYCSDMHISEVKEHLGRVPFVPFRIHVSDGSAFDVPHLDFVLVTKWAIHVAHEVSENEDNELLPARVTRIAVGHITRIEEIEPSEGVISAS